MSMFSMTNMNMRATAAARSAADFDARSASVPAFILDAVILASIFVVLRLSVWVLVNVLLVVLALVLVRIIGGLEAPTLQTHHKAMSQT